MGLELTEQSLNTVFPGDFMRYTQAEFDRLPQKEKDRLIDQYLNEIENPGIIYDGSYKVGKFASIQRQEIEDEQYEKDLKRRNRHQPPKRK